MILLMQIPLPLTLVFCFLPRLAFFFLCLLYLRFRTPLPRCDLSGGTETVVGALLFIFTFLFYNSSILSRIFLIKKDFVFSVSYQLTNNHNQNPTLNMTSVLHVLFFFAFVVLRVTVARDNNELRIEDLIGGKGG